MKLTTGISGCALVAGLMAFAPAQSHADTVGADGELYTQFNLKITVSDYNSKDKITKKSVTAKQVLSDLGYSKDVVLAVGVTGTNYGSVLVINKKSGAIIENLTAEGAMTLDAQQYLSSQKSGNNGAGSINSQGTVNITLDTTLSEISTQDDVFDISGIYDLSVNLSKVDKNGDQNAKIKGKANSLSGTGFFGQSTIDGTTVVTGSADISGNGKGNWF